jgi:carboxypeptidase C (cathepsin A)
MVNHLQSRYGMSFNGVVLLSAILDFATLGGDLGNVLYLPTFTAVAHYHRKIAGDRDALVREARDFALGDYATALLKGNSLDAAAAAAVARRLQELTGIPAARWAERDLRLDPGFFRTELLRAEGKVLGRFDARVVWDGAEPAAQGPDGDPSFDFIYGPFATALMDYLAGDLGYVETRPYEVMSRQMSGWRWNGENRIVSVADELGRAMRVNPHLRVLVMAGHTDLATPPECVAHSLRHLRQLPSPARETIRTAYYEAGHMFYLNPPDLEKARRDLLRFITDGR